MKILYLMSLLFITGLTQAADRWYEIEVLVFANLQADSNSEQWPANDAGPVVQGMALTPQSLQNAAVFAATGTPEYSVTKLGTGTVHLLDIARVLARNRNYKTLLHTVWRQSVGVGSSSFPVRLNGGKDYSAQYGLDGRLLSAGAMPALPNGLWEIDGFVHLSASKFLHVESDFVYRAPAAPAAPAVIPANDAGNLNWQTGETTEIADDHLQFYRLTQNRRVKLNELHYFDSPMFGFLLTMRPLDGFGDNATDARDTSADKTKAGP